MRPGDVAPLAFWGLVHAKDGHMIADRRAGSTPVCATCGAVFHEPSELSYPGVSGATALLSSAQFNAHSRQIAFTEGVGEPASVTCTWWTTPSKPGP
jgi:hypothetical protein